MDLLFGRGKHFLTIFQGLTWTGLLHLVSHHHHLLADQAGLRSTLPCLAVTWLKRVWSDRMSRLQENQFKSRKFYQLTIYFL